MRIDTAGITEGATETHAPRKARKPSFAPSAGYRHPARRRQRLLRVVASSQQRLAFPRPAQTNSVRIHEGVLFRLCQHGQPNTALIHLDALLIRERALRRFFLFPL